MAFLGLAALVSFGTTSRCLSNFLFYDCSFIMMLLHLLLVIPLLDLRVDIVCCVQGFNHI